MDAKLKVKALAFELARRASLDAQLKAAAALRDLHDAENELCQEMDNVGVQAAVIDDHVAVQAEEWWDVLPGGRIILFRLVPDAGVEES